MSSWLSVISFVRCCVLQDLLCFWYNVAFQSHWGHLIFRSISIWVVRDFDWHVVLVEVVLGLMLSWNCAFQCLGLFVLASNQLYRSHWEVARLRIFQIPCLDLGIPFLKNRILRIEILVLPTLRSGSVPDPESSCLSIERPLVLYPCRSLRQ